MTAPRRVVPGATYLVTRRCYQRTFRLRPSDATTHILAYCLAVALEKTGVQLHAVCFMSNHHHLVVHDPHGQLPDFLRELHRSTAKAMNASQGQWENLWSAEPCSAVRLADDLDIVDKIAYVAANPVAAGLVPTPEDWPGLSTWTHGDVSLERPQIYFRASGLYPGRAILRVVPPRFEHPGAWASRHIVGERSDPHKKEQPEARRRSGCRRDSVGQVAGGGLFSRREARRVVASASDSRSR